MTVLMNMKNTLRHGQNGHHFVDDILRCVFIMEITVFWLKFPRFFPKVPVDNMFLAVSVMAWHWTGGKPSAEPRWPNVMCTFASPDLDNLSLAFDPLIIIARNGPMNASRCQLLLILYTKMNQGAVIVVWLCVISKYTSISNAPMKRFLPAYLCACKRYYLTLCVLFFCERT